eukprot:COSAG02_NODE_3527_length_6612_cov_15.879011_4_plen_59_part_00
MERESTIDDAGQGFKYERTEERMEGKTTGGDFDFEKDGDIGMPQFPSVTAPLFLLLSP